MYIGRFAPSPTGLLHKGSLVAALGSYLRARQQQGQWLVRMEDLDPLREVAGAADDILQTLEAHALYWDGEVVYQSQRQSCYEAALAELLASGQVYACTCTRKGLRQQAAMGALGMIYPGICRDVQHPFLGRYAIRVRTHNMPLCFTDRLQGTHCQCLETELGDFIIRRSDGYFAYQLAVVVDDHLQGVTEVVRGEDLLDNTQRQNYLQRLLGYRQPDYCHLPMVKNPQGQKLSKQTHAPAVKRAAAAANLVEALELLRGSVVDEKITITELERLRQEPPEVILQWAVAHSASC